ncbi:hypothetical protein F5887DRAFT_924845 [Amanita rubescens]|nr:hypothetical protein F5887DRAFT_924845 [Amanita rubescens]
MTGYSVRRNRVGAFWCDVFFWICMDWFIGLDVGPGSVCDRASANAENAKEAVRALRREFGRKFLITLEGLITSSATSPVIRERLLLLWRSVQISIRLSLLISVKGPKDSGFRRLWKKVKPADKPEEGVPFDIDDATSNAPRGPRHSQNVIPGFIPPEEVIRRLFQECSINMGNAAYYQMLLLLDFHAKCRSSQELIFWQIPWATAGVEHSRVARSQLLRTGQRPPDEDGPTTEEKLLGELLKANEGLQFVLKQYEDLERVAVERRTEDTSGYGAVDQVIYKALPMK